MKNKLLTIVLAVFLGGLGIHRFYLGNYLMGVFYLLFSWSGIPTIIAWAEALYFFSISESEFNHKYG